MTRRRRQPTTLSITHAATGEVIGTMPMSSLTSPRRVPAFFADVLGDRQPVEVVLRRLRRPASAAPAEDAVEDGDAEEEGRVLALPTAAAS